MNNTLIMASRNVYLVSAGYDSIIRFWDISGGHTKRTLRYEDSSDVKVKMVRIIDVIIVINSRLIVFPSLMTDLILRLVRLSHLKCMKLILRDKIQKSIVRFLGHL